MSIINYMSWTFKLQYSFSEINERNQQTCFEKLYYCHSRTFVKNCCGVCFVEFYALAFVHMAFPYDA